MNAAPRRRSGPAIREITPDAAAIVKEFARVHRRVVKTDDALRALLDERAAIVVAAREMDPPITHRALADAVGLTPAAVLLIERRYRKSNPKETPHS